MFSHESIPLISLFVVMLLCVLAAIAHPLHAFSTWIKQHRSRSSLKRNQHAKKLYSR